MSMAAGTATESLDIRRRPVEESHTCQQVPRSFFDGITQRAASKVSFDTQYSHAAMGLPPPPSYAHTSTAERAEAAPIASVAWAHSPFYSRSFLWSPFTAAQEDD